MLGRDVSMRHTRASDARKYDQPSAAILSFKSLLWVIYLCCKSKRELKGIQLVI